MEKWRPKQSHRGFLVFGSRRERAADRSSRVDPNRPHWLHPQGIQSSTRGVETATGFERHRPHGPVRNQQGHAPGQGWVLTGARLRAGRSNNHHQRSFSMLTILPGESGDESERHRSNQPETDSDETAGDGLHGDVESRPPAIRPQGRMTGRGGPGDRISGPRIDRTRKRSFHSSRLNLT